MRMIYCGTVIEQFSTYFMHASHVQISISLVYLPGHAVCFSHSELMLWN